MKTSDGGDSPGRVFAEKPVVGVAVHAERRPASRPSRRCPSSRRAPCGSRRWSLTLATPGLPLRRRERGFGIQLETVRRHRPAAKRRGAGRRRRPGAPPARPRSTRAARPPRGGCAESALSRRRSTGSAARRSARRERQGRERAGRLADVPLDGMQPVAAVGDVGGADVLAGGEQVRRRATGNRAPSGIWNGRVRRADADVVGAGAVDVDRIPADADRVGEVRRPRPGLVLRRDVLLDDRPGRADAPRLADVRDAWTGRRRCPSRRGAAGAPARRAVRPWPAPRSAASGGSPGSTRLASCSAAATSRAGRSMMLRVAVVVAWPVEHGQVVSAAPPSARRVEQPAIGPQPALGAGHLLVEPVVEPAAVLAVDLAAVDFDAQAVGLRVAVVLRTSPAAGIDVRSRSPAALEGEGVGEALHAVRLRLLRLRVRLAGLARWSRRRRGARRRPAAAGRRARWRRSPAPGGTGARAGPVEVDRDHASRSRSPSRVAATALRAQEDAAAGRPRRAGRAASAIASTPTARLEGQARDPAGARIEVGRCRSRRRLAVVVAQRLAQGVVARGAAEGLDVLVLVERGDALRGELAAEPVGFLEQADAAAAARGRQRRGDAAGAAADDQDLALDLVRRDRSGDPTTATPGSPACRHPHDVDDLVEPALVPAPVARPQPSGRADERKRTALS